MSVNVIGGSNPSLNSTSSALTTAEQAALTAGKVRAGGTTAGTATTIFVQSATPTANATGDLWFW